ncbi:MAG: DUF3631 domain-containing protein [Candidatus Acidiferrales bacterium]
MIDTNGASATTSDPRAGIEEAEQFIQRYAVIARGLPLVLALWSQATHQFERFDAFPYLAITSSTKRCGKTRTGELLEMLCANPMATVSATPAVIFRSIAEQKPTLIIDEAETLSTRSDRAEALREILNAGNRAGRMVRRCEAPSYRVRVFPIFCPKVIILIGDLSDTLADRCIPVQMKRRRNEPIQRFRRSVAANEAAAIRDKMAEWAARYSSAVVEWYNNHDLEFLQDREEEIWLPLFAVCSIAAPERFLELKAIAERLSQLKHDSEPTDYGLRLLADIREVFAARQEGRIATSALLVDLNALSESPWADWTHGNRLNSRSLAHLLKPFGIHSENLRFGESVAKGYTHPSFADAWECYLPPNSAASRYTATEPVNTGENADSQSATSTDCSAGGSGQLPNENGACSDVADNGQWDGSLTEAWQTCSVHGFGEHWKSDVGEWHCPLCQSPPSTSGNSA